MREFLYTFWALLLGVLAFFTHEIVTFIMLGFILMVLNTISKHLLDIKKLIIQRVQTKADEAEEA